MKALSWILMLAGASAVAEPPPTQVAVWNTGSYPSGIAVDEAGLVYACHFRNGNLMVFTPNGTLLRTIGSQGSGNGQFINPEGIALDGAGRIFVTDWALGRVQKFANDGTWLATWSFALTRPQGIAVDDQGFVYVADSQHVRKFTSDGNLVLSWGGEGSGPGQFRAAQGVAIDSRGRVHVADSINLTVQEFTAEGLHARTIPVAGVEIQGIAFDPADNLYVCDFPGYRITKFAPDGTVLSSWTATRPIFIAADRFWNLYVTSSVGASITKYSYPPPLVSIQATNWSALKALYRD